MRVGVQRRGGGWRRRPTGTTTLAHRECLYGHLGWRLHSGSAGSLGLACRAKSVLGQLDGGAMIAPFAPVLVTCHPSG